MAWVWGLSPGEATLCNTVTLVLLVESARNEALFASSMASISLLYFLFRITGNITHLLKMHSLETVMCMASYMESL